MVVSNFSGPPAPTTVYHNGGSLRSPKTSSFPQHFVSPFALSFEIWNFKKQISKLHFFFKHIFQKLSRWELDERREATGTKSWGGQQLVRFETWQRLWKRTRGLGVGPAAGRMGRFALELVDGDSFQCFSWKHWPARLLNNLPQNKVWSENLCNWGLRNLKWSRISPCLYFLAGLLGSDSGGRLRPRRPILNMEKQFVLCFFFLHVCWELHCFSPCLS